MSNVKLTKTKIAELVVGDGATLTLKKTRSKDEPTVLTFKRKTTGPGRPKTKPIYVTSVNENGSSDFLGTVFTWDKLNKKAQSPEFKHSTRHGIAEDDPRVKAAIWLIEVINGKILIPASVHIFQGQIAVKAKSGEFVVPDKLRKTIVWTDVDCRHCYAKSGEKCKSPKGGTIKKPHDVRGSQATREDNSRKRQITELKNEHDVKRFGQCEAQYCESACVSKKVTWCEYHEKQVKEEKEAKDKAAKNGKCTECKHRTAEKKDGLCTYCIERAERAKRRLKEQEEREKARKKAQSEAEKAAELKRLAEAEAARRKVDYEKAVEEGRSPLVDRTVELVTNGWTTVEAMKQAQKELDGGCFWLPEMGLPAEKVEDQEGLIFDLASFEEEDDDDDDDAEIMVTSNPKTKK